MEIFLAIVVASAVIFFGALISMGNERQRKAIDGLKEQVVLWARQDLLLKRKGLAQNVHIDDPMKWFNKKISTVVGYNLDLYLVETHKNPEIILFKSKSETKKYLLSLIHPDQLLRLNHQRKNPLNRYMDRNPAININKSSNVYELSILNGGILFDLELQYAWEKLSGEPAIAKECLWVYEIQ